MAAARLRPAVRKVSFVALSLSFTLLACRAFATTDEERPDYQLSTSATEEVLFVRPHGVYGGLVPWYQLYGDGRLVRDIVHQGTQAPVHSHEVRLAPADIDLLFELIVTSKLVDLTKERLIDQAGGPLPQAIDAGTYVLTLHFDSYARPGQAEIAPFSTRVEMHAPWYLVKFLPQIPEVQGFAVLLERLDGYFSESASKVIFGSAEVE